LYDESTCERLETILTLTRDLGVNLAGVEIILNLKEQVQQLQEKNQLLSDMLRQTIKERAEVPRYHALVKVESGSIQVVDEE
jgi:MerR family transcriptional regulator/heat shock protein HspR